MKLLLQTLLCSTFFLTYLPGECKAQCVEETECCKEFAIQPLDAPHQFYIGPEIYHVKRTRGSGSVQTGTSFGVRTGYDFIKPCKLYWGVEAFYGYGRLKGKTAKGRPMESSLSDTLVEGRLGFTFPLIKKCGLLLTPYGGYGYFEEANHCLAPSPIHVHFKTKFKFFSGGVLSRVNLTTNLQAGLNIKMKWPIDPKCHVTHDPGAKNSSLGIDEDYQYRIELPFKYQLVKGCQSYVVALVPFYELRKYGKKAHFPFDFLETEFKIYGITAELFCTF